MTIRTLPLAITFDLEVTEGALHRLRAGNLTMWLSVADPHSRRNYEKERFWVEAPDPVSLYNLPWREIGLLPRRADRVVSHRQPDLMLVRVGITANLNLQPGDSEEEVTARLPDVGRGRLCIRLHDEEMDVTVFLEDLGCTTRSVEATVVATPTPPAIGR